MIKIKSLTSCTIKNNNSSIVLNLITHDGTLLDIELPISLSVSLSQTLYKAIETCENKTHQTQEQEETQGYHPNTVNIGHAPNLDSFVVSFDKGMKSEANYILTSELLLKLCFESSNYLNINPSGKNLH